MYNVCVLLCFYNDMNVHPFSSFFESRLSVATVIIL